MKCDLITLVLEQASQLARTRLSLAQLESCNPPAFRFLACGKKSHCVQSVRLLSESIRGISGMQLPVNNRD